MARHGKVDMANGWVLDDPTGYANVAENRADEAVRDLDYSLEGRLVYPAFVSTPSLESEHIRVGDTSIESTSVTTTNLTATAQVQGATVVGTTITATGEIEGATLVGTTSVTTPVLTLSAPRWEDLRVPVSATKLGGTKDPGYAVFKTNGAGSQGVFAYRFDHIAEEELYFTTQMPHSWLQGSTIEAHVHWCPSTADAGNVIWGLEYTIAKNTGTFGNTTLIYNTPQATGSTAFKHYMAEIGDIVMTGMTVSSILMCRIFRATAGADTYDADACLLEIDFHYQTDTPGGSDAEDTKS